MSASKANAPRLSSYSYIHEKINRGFWSGAGVGGVWVTEGQMGFSSLCVTSAPELYAHLSGRRGTRLCSSASAAGSTCAERRCTATPGHLGRAGPTGTCTRQVHARRSGLLLRKSETCKHTLYVLLFLQNKSKVTITGHINQLNKLVL